MSRQALRRALLPVVILAGGLALAALLASARKPPAPARHVNPGPLVTGIAVHPEEVPVTVEGDGTVRARATVQIMPQVAGRVVRLGPGMVAGGTFRAGEPLVEIERTDYELAVRRAEAAVARARVALELAEADAAVARAEWERTHPDREPPSPLVVKAPQVEQARADLEAARADLEAARLALERTRISLPFDGRVVVRSVGVGQYVAPGQVLGTAYRLAPMEVPVPLMDRELAWFELPGAEAEVTAEFAGATRRWRGRAVRTEGQVDAGTRMIRVVVEVPRPVSHGDHPVRLLPGTFVHVAIRGHTLRGAFRVPRHAVHEGATVWVVRDGSLRIVPVEVARTQDDSVLITRGLADGDVVVTSQLEVVTDGMRVRVAMDGPAGEGPEREGA